MLLFYWNGLFVGLPVQIEVRYRRPVDCFWRPVGTLQSDISGRWAKRASAAIQQHGHSAAHSRHLVVASQDQVRLAIAVEIRHGHPRGGAGRRLVHRRCEDPVAPVQVLTDRAFRPVRGHEVGPAVTIEVTDSHRERIDACRERKRQSESAIPLA